jgi:hypothetical protein
MSVIRSEDNRPDRGTQADGVRWAPLLAKVPNGDGQVADRGREELAARAKRHTDDGVRVSGERPTRRFSSFTTGPRG